MHSKGAQCYVGAHLYVFMVNTGYPLINATYVVTLHLERSRPPPKTGHLWDVNTEIFLLFIAEMVRHYFFLMFRVLNNEKKLRLNIKTTKTLSHK